MFEILKTWIAAHPAYASLVAAWLVSNLVATLPNPRPEERWYGWLYNFLHLSAGNAPRVFPGLRIAQADAKPAEAQKA